MATTRTSQITLFLVFGIAALVAGYWFAEHRQQTESGNLAKEQSDTLVSFAARDSQGMDRNLDEWRGQPLIVNFWATWCTPCREEIPDLIDAQQEFANRIQILGFAVDRAEPVASFIDEFGFNYPTLVGESEGMELMALYGNNGALPFTIAFDRDGQLVARKLGQVSASKIVEMVDAANP
ncbi:MAG: thioredoxin [marine bacterium B5-7]|nr:MAG: thioredoxin [marine bacterium B5-7]